MTTTTAQAHAREFSRLLDSREARIGVVGIGYVGLPLSLAFVAAGFKVLGFDVNPTKVAQVNRGEPYLQHLDPGPLRAARAEDRLVATTDFSRLGECDAVLICVPTPLTPQREPDVSFIARSAEAVRDTLRPGQL